MGPTRKSRSVNRRYLYGSEASPSKDGDGAKRSNSRKRKLTDMLGPRWTMEELTRFYESYRKNGKDWKKVATAVRNRSIEMVEALYTMNRAYLSLPHGTASAAGLSAMMTDHYSNLAGSDSEQESNDGLGSSRKAQKCAHGKVQPTTSKASVERFDSPLPTIFSNNSCLSLLKKKRAAGSRPHPVGKRTPRFPASFSHANSEKYFSPTKHGLEFSANAHDDEVAHEIAVALAEASQKGGSPQVSGTPSKRGEGVKSSAFQHIKIKESLADVHSALASDTDEEDLQGSTEADTGELSIHKRDMMDSVSGARTRPKVRSLDGKIIEVYSKTVNHLVDIKEECSGTDEGKKLGAMRGKLDSNANESKILRPTQSQRKKSKKVLFAKDESPKFDALQTLADLSLLMPTEIEDESRVQFKVEHDDHVDESVPSQDTPVNQSRERRRSTGVRSEVMSSKATKPGKGSAFVSEENQDVHQPVTKRTRKKTKVQAAKIEQTESDTDRRHIGVSPGSEAGDVGKKLMAKSKKSSQISSPNLMKMVENSFSTDLRKEGSDSTLSAMQIPTDSQVNLPTKVGSRRKMGLNNPQIQKDLKFPEILLNDQSNMPFGSVHETTFDVVEKLSNCLSNQRLRRWCTYEWFYSAIDYPWFAKREFVEYLQHVGLGHVPRLTRVEWGVIRSSLGKPRRFSKQFLKEEKEKLNQYRNSVRKHYTELREGVREGLATDLAKPLSVGQRVIAIHPKTRAIHDGSILTVDHSKCRVQFDQPDLGVEFVMDIDCTPLNPYENIPASHGRHAFGVDRIFENFNELHINGRANEYVKLSTGDNLDNTNGGPQLSPLSNAASVLKQTKVTSANANVQTNIGSTDSATYQQIAYSQPGTLTPMQAKEADVQALAALKHALDKKEAIVLELRRMNDDVLESETDVNSSLKDSEPFRKQYAAILIQLHEANEQVSFALHCLRERNTYQGKPQLTIPKPMSNLVDAGSMLNSFDGFTSHTHEPGSHVNEIMDSSRSKARSMVNAAMQALSSLKIREHTIDKIEEAIDYVNDQLPSHDSSVSAASDPKSTNATEIEARIPSDLITKCVATLLMIQKCTERQFPPSDVAQILDSAVTSLQPHSSQNLPVYTEIQKCVGIIKNQILALIPT